MARSCGRPSRTCPGDGRPAPAAGPRRPPRPSPRAAGRCRTPDNADLGLEHHVFEPASLGSLWSSRLGVAVLPLAGGALVTPLHRPTPLLHHGQQRGTAVGTPRHRRASPLPRVIRKRRAVLTEKELAGPRGERRGSVFDSPFHVGRADRAIPTCAGAATPLSPDPVTVCGMSQGDGGTPPRPDAEGWKITRPRAQAPVTRSPYPR